MSRVVRSDCRGAAETASSSISDGGRGIAPIKMRLRHRCGGASGAPGPACCFDISNTADCEPTTSSTTSAMTIERPPPIM